jgi:hypothetical protein
VTCGLARLRGRLPGWEADGDVAHQVALVDDETWQEVTALTRAKYGRVGDLVVSLAARTPPGAGRPCAGAAVRLAGRPAAYSVQVTSPEGRAPVRR